MKKASGLKTPGILNMWRKKSQASTHCDPTNRQNLLLWIYPDNMREMVEAAGIEETTIGLVAIKKTR
jgi:hypothetical protein